MASGCNTLLWIIIILLIIFFIWYFFFRNKQVSFFNQTTAAPSQNVSVDNFSHAGPRREFTNLVAEFGNPDVLVNKPYGIAIWKNKGYYDIIKLLDETIQNNDPEPHCVFLITVVTAYIPRESFCKVLDMSDTLQYDRIKGELSVKTHNMRTNVATLYTAFRTIADPDNYAEYKSKFDEIVAAAAVNENYDYLQNELGNLIAENNRTYQNQLSQNNKNCTIDQ